MKIVPIFESYLYAFHYENESENEFGRLMELWNDVGYLREFAKANNVPDINSFVKARLRDAEEIDELLEEITTQNNDLGTYFIPFHPQEYSRDVTLSVRKGKHRKNRLRLYAIKVYENCYVITSGAIKMSQRTQDHIGTDTAVKTMHKAQNYLNEAGVIDDDSLYELLNEEL